jgi:hypothetical protein
MTPKLEITTGEDEEGLFQQDSLVMNEMRTNITKRYYKIVDEQMLKNMPLDTLKDLVKKGIDEINRRNGINCLEVYNEIYSNTKRVFLEQGETEYKASRMANKMAVQNTWNSYNDIKSYKKEG